MQKLKVIARKALVSAAALTVLFVLAEVVTRAMEPGPFSLLDRKPYTTHPDVPGIHRHKPGFQGRWDGSWYSTNTLGLRGPELELGDDGEVLRVVALGDSCTFGKGVKEVDSWPRQLEQILDQDLAPGRRALVANFGVNGYSGATYERIFKDLGHHVRPHVVVIGYNLNDFPNAIRATDEFVFQERAARKFISQGLRDFMGRFACYRWLRQSYYHMQREKDWRNAESFARGAADQPVDSEIWRKQEGHLASIRDQAAAMGAEVAVFLFPYESQVYLDSFDSTPIDRLRDVCQRLGLPFVDLAREFRASARSTDPWQDLFLKGDRYHPNRDGYRIVAQRVKALMDEQGWLESGG